MKKKSIALFALSLALISVPVVSVANAEVTNSNIAVSESATSQPEVVKAYITTENGLEEISLNEYQKLLSQEQPQTVTAQVYDSGNRISPMADTGLDFVFKRKLIQSAYYPQQLQVDQKTDITDYIKNSSKTTTLTQMVGWSKSFSWSANMTISVKWNDAVTQVLGGGWSTTETHLYNSSLTVQPGYQAKLQFTPIYKVVRGDLVGYNYVGTVLERLKNVTIKTPVKLAGGKVQGVVTVVERRL
ncbi:hypothetical protein ACYCS5_13720 [Paenibacillus sp. SEL3]|uniref:Uncharacterized protein n=1 Tax=Paenibacillus polymyxa TaxID=1406 RepID=A0A8I1IRC9_PAEPO|nr:MULTISPECIES: hypothetical protein [Paenibacillus]KAF6575715.1 hypothetical protein G9G53_04755 [Paenibacillus sp. EKM206P]KAF6589347.1 hypothetical protein G9G52_08640 [Paenibacillus sp. EKM205P]MBM0634442.1 hypothetical protein [Paenibacillus polymyxa]